jgi:hypothetical protein
MTRVTQDLSVLRNLKVDDLIASVKGGAKEDLNPFITTPGPCPW